MRSLRSFSCTVATVLLFSEHLWLAAFSRCVGYYRPTGCQGSVRVARLFPPLVGTVGGEGDRARPARPRANRLG